MRTKTKIFEKKPNKGGTPAKLNSVNDIILVKIFDAPRVEKENRVLMCEFKVCIIVVNKTKEVRL